MFVQQYPGSGRLTGRFQQENPEPTGNRWVQWFGEWDEEAFDVAFLAEEHQDCHQPGRYAKSDCPDCVKAGWAEARPVDFEPLFNDVHVYGHFHYKALCGAAGIEPQSAETVRGSCYVISGYDYVAEWWKLSREERCAFVLGAAYAKFLQLQTV